MSTWVALNIEPDEAIEEEVDDTKEIQIEEALKLYQNALKLHSQGPQFYEQAGKAYEALLDSEIFKYPESLSDHKRAALQDAEPQVGGPTNDAVVGEAALDFSINDSTSSTLQQTIYLSYKNHGQYVLDALRASLQELSKLSEDSSHLSSKIAESSTTALAQFAEALERDDTDLNLWRQSARLCSTLQSYRLTRFCLESVLADDDNRLEVRSEQLGLEETFAEEGLRKTLHSVQDRLSVSLVPIKKPKKALLKFFKQQSDPYPYLPSLPDNLQDLDSSRNPLAFRASTHEIKIDSLTWAAIGQAILTFLDDKNEPPSLAPGTSITISLPADSPELKTASITAQRRPSKAQVDETNNQDVQMNDAQSVGARSVTGAQGRELAMEHGDDQSSVDQRAEKQLIESLEVQSSQHQQSADPQEDVKAEEVDVKYPENTSRKRSSGSAITEDQAERLRVKSRRTRLRDSLAEASTHTDDVVFDQAKYYEDLLEPYVQTDEGVFGTVGALLSKLGVEDLGTFEELRRSVASANERKDSPATPVNVVNAEVLLQDLRNVLTQWDERLHQVMQQSDSLAGLQDIKSMGRSGLAVFLEHSKKTTHKLKLKQTFSGEDELFDFIREVNGSRLHLHDVVFEWLGCLLRPDYKNFSTHDNQFNDWSLVESSYVAYQWPTTLKDVVLQLLSLEDEYIHGKLEEGMRTLEHQILEAQTGTPFRYTAKHFADLEMIQAIYELHLDLYAPMNAPNNETDHQTRTLQQDRLARWSMLARSALTHFIDCCPERVNRERITVRHIWASTFHSNMGVDAQREHILLCLEDLKRLFSSLNEPVFSLANSSIMSEMSCEAIDQEISKLNSMDFFTRIFNPDSEDPVGLIETIEPIVEPSAVQLEEGSEDQQSLQRREMGSFLDRGDATLRLFLWRRLQDAYRKIDYPPKVVSCHLRSIETIIKELRSPAYVEEPGEHRQATLVRWLKSLDGMLSKTVMTVLQESDKAYDCFDMEHVKSSMSAVAFLIRLLHSFVLYDDSVRVGQSPGIDLRAALAKSLENFKEKMRDMLVRCWVLLYTLLKEAIAQNQEMFDEPLEDRVYYLRAVHNSLGLRQMCKRSRSQFLKLVKSELLALDVEQDIEADICQILFDIHGVKLSLSDHLLTDHGCVPEKLDRSTAITMIDFVMKQTKKINIKDLSKSELKNTIEKMQQSIGTTKAVPPVSYNRRILNAYLKTPINPSELVRAIQGVTDLPFIPVPSQTAVIANSGWYFLLGYAALTKFRSQKRLNPVPTTDLDEAISWFRQDLEHGTSRWESWYRLAQVWDSKVEEDITWSADKINNNRTELVTWQRNAIHCYAMAVATAAKTAESGPETGALLADLYTDFGIRLYSSSREPLSMAAFSVADFTRHFSNEESQQMYEGRPFKEMKIYNVWRLAAFLLRQALVDKPKNWMIHYMLSKCLWKMFSCDDSVRGSSKRISLDSVLDSLLDTIDALPQRKDSRSEPIFEPHYKLVSIVHKLVIKEVLTPAEASKTLVATPWARKVPACEDRSSWKKYILDVLKNLKNADKANWHHRMAVRAARIIYDDDKGAIAAAEAKSELTQQIFTKTMTIQVWKPEYERPGRHFVYTTRYAYFFVTLLDQLDDRANLEQLLRRVRKKQGDFINHTKLWEDMCLTYARVIRRAAGISEGHEESVFKPIGWEEFSSNTARLEELPQLAPESPSLLELLRDAIELKKLNNNLMKVALLEDLIADVYSRIYEVNLPILLEQVNEENKEKMKVDHILMTADGAATADTSTPPTSAPASETPAPRGRTKGIARRDIQKRAEAIVSRKVPPRAPATKAPTTTETESATNATNSAGSKPAVEISVRRPSAAVVDSAGQQSDIPNSLHDSADDESELSEIDEDKLSKLAADPKMLFPNFGDRRRGSLEPDSEISAQASPSGDADAANENEEVGELEGDDREGEDEGEAGPDADLEEESMNEDGDGDGDGDEAGEGEGENENENGNDGNVNGNDEDDDVDMEAGEEEEEAPGQDGEIEGDTTMEGTDAADGEDPEHEHRQEQEQEQQVGGGQEGEPVYDSEFATEL
ncbi:putative transcriptional corepressor of histone genes (Hir3) [Aspergillus foveolatus]|uniref:putative transcriptional corepressor of histone genes (Hir3) n=1 Tax=Aspergillus foveolatus TaxID=210207 RepID=UPI003CCD5579